jgi:PTS system ascorbate-specific IIB component
MKKPRIMVVCGFGLGSSIVLRMTLDKVLKEEGLKADEATAKGQDFDLVLTSKEMVDLFKDSEEPAIVIENFLSKEEVREKALPSIQDLFDE